MSNFTTLNLTGERVLVRGTDVTGAAGETVLSSAEWTHIKGHKEFNKAQDAFDSAVEEFFAPLIEASAKLDRAFEAPEPDPMSYVVLTEGVEGTAPQAADVRKLSHDSIVLRIIESGDTDRLVWVGDTLEVLEKAAKKPGPVKKTTNGRRKATS